MQGIRQRLAGWLNDWLNEESPPPELPLYDFDRMRFELRPADVILVEGRSRAAEVIKIISQSPWSHSALYIGRLFDIRDPKIRARVEASFEGDPEEQLIVEALIGQGTVVTPLSKYRFDHLRICRPEGLAPDDAQAVLQHAIQRLGLQYDLRQLVDLARFLFPWGILPRRWRSSLFQHNAGEPTRTLCSTLLAEAYSAVNFPILPFIGRSADGSLRFFKRNPRLFAPRDFDYSPYFHIIKYPFLGVGDLGLYRRLPWSDDDWLYNDEPRDAVAVAMPQPARDSEDDVPSGTEPGAGVIAPKAQSGFFRARS